ncbi:MAG: ribonuclease P protein component [Planctomycetota bacterium]|jgi:ribonuclease P protein component
MTMSDVASTSRFFGFPRRMRLRRAAEYEAVYAAGVRRHAGPLLIWSRPNGLDRTRRVGKAPVRNAVKRRLREAFRLHRLELPAGYDLVVSARRHDPESPSTYAALIIEAAGAMHRTWQRRAAADDDGRPGDLATPEP